MFQTSVAGGCCRHVRCCSHSTHAHAASADAAEVSRENATSSETLRASRVITSPPRRLPARLTADTHSGQRNNLTRYEGAGSGRLEGTRRELGRLRLSLRGRAERSPHLPQRGPQCRNVGAWRE